MTPLSVNNGTGEVLEGGASCSTISTSLREVELGTNYSIEAIQDEQQLLNIQSDINALGPPSINCINSPNFHNGTKVNIEGINHITLNNHITQQIEKDASPKTPRSKYIKYLIISIITGAVICAIALITVKYMNPEHIVIVPSTTEESTTTTRRIPIHHVFNRSSWNARDPAGELITMDTIPFIVIIKHTKTSSCYDISTCSAAMQDLQNTDIKEYKLPDIRYNFMIGGDGNIYEGRGWKVQNEQMNNTIDLAYLGDFNVEVPNQDMVTAGPWLIVLGGLNMYLDPARIKVVCHNQTEDTDSPGVNLYKEVIKWKFYSSDIIK